MTADVAHRVVAELLGVAGARIEAALVVSPRHPGLEALRSAIDILLGVTRREPEPTYQLFRNPRPAVPGHQEE